METTHKPAYLLAPGDTVKLDDLFLIVRGVKGEYSRAGKHYRVDFTDGSHFYFTPKETLEVVI